MEEFKTYLMEDLIEEIAMGPFGSNIKVDCFVDSGVPVLNGANLQGYKLREDSFNYVTTEKADSLNKANAYRGDIVITHRGTLGQIVYIPKDSKYERYVISQSQFRVRINPKAALPEYVVYFFHTLIGQHRLLANASQVGVPAIARPSTTFKKVEIELPSIREQERIVAILNSLSDKIELNNRINHNLEEQAQALYKSWFVDFEPFKNGDFVDTELGLIPKGWRIGCVNDIISIQSGFAFKSESFVEEGQYKLITIKAVQDGFLTLSGADSLNEPLPPKMPAYCILSQGDILLSLTGNVGRVCLVDTERLLLNQRVAKLHPICERDRAYTYFLARSTGFKDSVLRLARGTAQMNLSPIETGLLNIPIAPNGVMAQFSMIATPILEALLSNLRESSILKGTRDRLLPELLLGQLTC